jgi:hypothetical protein
MIRTFDDSYGMRKEDRFQNNPKGLIDMQKVNSQPEKGIHACPCGRKDTSIAVSTEDNAYLEEEAKKAGVSKKDHLARIISKARTGASA